MQDRQKGLLLTTLGVLLLSPDALVLRWLATDAMQILSWRGLLMAGGLAVLLLARYRSSLPAKLWQCGRTGLACAVCYGVSTIFYVQAMMLAGAANTLLIFSITPLIAAALGWFWLGERLPLRTLVAILVCLGGVALIVSDESPGSSPVGNLYALAATILLAGNFTLARSRPLIDMSPAPLLGALLASAIAFAIGGPPSLSGEQLLGLSLMSGLLLPLGFMLVQLGPRSISATEVGLLFLLEVVLGPLWVWWLLGEAPSPTVLAGGAIVLLALLGHALAGWRQAA
jgi:drug/metabolite transporter (DMT)-like permease